MELFAFQIVISNISHFQDIDNYDIRQPARAILTGAMVLVLQAAMNSLTVQADRSE